MTRFTVFIMGALALVAVILGTTASSDAQDGKWGNVKGRIVWGG